jgi:hypothetical protein
MPTLNNVKSNAATVFNHTVGEIVTSSATAAALTITPGFMPRIVRFHNVTDRISDEWYDGMDEMSIYEALIGIAAKLDADAGVTDTNYGTLTAPASAALSDLVAAVGVLTAKLDADAGVTDTNYTALYGAPAATVVALRAAIVGIDAKLDADAGVTDTNYGALWNNTASSLHTVAAGTRTFEKTNGILVNTDGSFTLSATTMVASKRFSWEAIG